MSVKRKIQLIVLNQVRAKGKVTDKELYEVVRKDYEISYGQLLNILMSLEIEGFLEIHAGKDSLIIMPRTSTKRVER